MPKTTPQKRLIKIILLFNVLWTIVFITVYICGISAQKRSTLSLATKEAEASFNKDLVYRRWAAEHGGVYVQSTEGSPSNPFLSHIPERDVTTPSNRNLTLINPAYMTRQVYELAAEQYGVLSHITSLNPIRPGNEPDEWEKNSLAEFAKGKDKIIATELIEGRPYLRYIKRLITEKSCLKCHAVQGYQEGDIRGGISTSVPLSGYYAIDSKFQSTYSLVLFSTWLIGVLLFNSGSRLLFQQLSENEKAEEQLRAQSLLLNKSQEIAHLGSWHLDIKKNVLTWSEEQHRIYGQTQQEFDATYEAFLDTIHPDDRDIVKATYTEAIENNLPYESTHRIIRKNGEIRLVFEKSEDVVDENGETIHFFGFTHDITDKSKLELELKKYHQMVSTAEDMMLFVDNNYKYLAVNNAFLKANSYRADKVIGRTVADLLGQDVFEKHVKLHLDKCLEGNEVRYQDWFDYDKGKRFMDVAYYTYYNPDSSVGGVVASIRDITDLKKSESEAIALENRLQQAQKMEAIGTLAGGIAHDFNNILSVILGYVEMVKDDSPPDSSIVKDLDLVLEAGNRAKNLVKQILAFSRQEGPHRIPLQPASIVKEAIKMLRPSLPTTIEIKQDIDTEIGLVFADPTQLNQVLMNLCTNAFHAMEETGGVLRISLKETDILPEELFQEPGVDTGKFVELSVSDTGSGIAPEILDKMFEPYFTTKGVGRGTGMGLSIIYGIITSSGGFINVNSELEEGTVFRVFLPVIEEDFVPAIETVDKLKGNERILLVDDEEVLAQMGKDMLERLGYKVTIRHNSLEALETFQNQPDQFDLVITDQTMPGMTGSDIARKMIQIRPDIPIILCTGYSSIISEEEAKSMGIKEFAFKPLGKKDIASLIRKVLDVL